MYLKYFLLLVFTFILSCHSSAPESAKTKPVPGLARGEPFDRHGDLVFTRHARCRMDCRHITPKEIHEILEEGTINYEKSEPAAQPDPKYALEGYTAEQQHLRIIIAPEGMKLIVITCIELGVEWSCHCN
jgi:Domain of unknown function (DUF4258)